MSKTDSPLLRQVRALPARPGVYMMKEAQGSVIYVGKAAQLRDRVRSYFGAPAGLSPKTRKLVEQVSDLEYIVTDSEAEALILECNLIKKHKPRYNVRLKDDKQYPYLRVNIHEPWPQVFITRRVADDGARYFGPYASSGSVRQTLALLKKLFPYRSCNKVITGTDPRPCLDYHIHRCLGPCIGAVSQGDYAHVIQQVTLFLEGRQDRVVKDLQRSMEAAAGRLEFERAAMLRDQIRAVERVVERQKVVSTQREDQDVVAFARDGNECCVLVFQIRGGKLFGREPFVLEGAQDEDPSAVMTSFVQQYYASSPHVPAALLLQHPVQEPEVIAHWLRERRGKSVALRVPQRGEKKRLLAMAEENARETLQQLHVRWLADTGKTAAALTELQDMLDLPRLPRRMECYDISNISGAAAVASMVVFEDGRSKPAEYRRFRIKTVAGVDDYAMMQEVLRRRFKRAKEALAGRAAQELLEDEEEGEVERPLRVSSGSSWAALPDLVVIDGGRGHLNAATEVLRELDVPFLPICALAKQQEEVFLPHVAESVLLPAASQGLYLLQRIRDEAHRFAITYHRQVRSQAAVASILDQVPGIGPRRKKALIQRFGSVKAAREAPLEEIASVVGMTVALAKKVKAYA
ncbi:MAG: excinuclease ABC subunit UvrC [Chloroflexi bacterium]|nr:excinuclease ABC subunit UvrC [Chloroflexota bacterium]